MSDRKPPCMAGDERGVLQGLLRHQRGSLVRKLSGLGAPDAVASPAASGTCLLWLANHMAGAEATWVLRRLAQLPERDVPSRHAGHADIIRELIDGSTGR